MITENQIIRAINMMGNYRTGLEPTKIEKQIMGSLEVYMDRDEFDGSLESAINCLRMACYEIELENGVKYYD